MKFFVGGRPPPNFWDLLENWLDKLIFERLWKRFKRWSKKFLIGACVTIAIFVFLAVLFLPARVTKSVILSVPGIHEFYECLFLSKTEKASADNIRQQLGYFGGNLALSFMYSLDSVKTEKERARILNGVNFPEPQIVGFETINIPSEKLADTLTKAVPKGFLFNVKKIAYVNREALNPKWISYGFSFRSVGSANPLTKNITIFYQRKNANVKVIKTFLIHEIAHLNDWNSNTLLTREERLALFCATMERLGEQDEYKARYIESINPKNKYLKKYMQAIEYWAEINEEHLNNGKKVCKLSPKDQKIVKDILQKMDPRYL